MEVTTNPSLQNPLKGWVTRKNLVVALDLHVRCLEKVYSPKWWFNGDLPWYKVKDHLEQIQVSGNTILSICAGERPAVVNLATSIPTLMKNQQLHLPICMSLGQLKALQLGIHTNQKTKMSERNHKKWMDLIWSYKIWYNFTFLFKHKQWCDYRALYQRKEIFQEIHDMEIPVIIDIEKYICLCLFRHQSDWNLPIHWNPSKLLYFLALKIPGIVSPPNTWQCRSTM